MRTFLLAAAVLFLAAIPARAQYGYGSYSYDNYGIAGAIQSHYSWVGAAPPVVYVVPVSPWGYGPGYYGGYRHYRGW